MEILKVTNLKKHYGKDTNLVKAVDNVNFSVNEGEFVAISLLVILILILPCGSVYFMEFSNILHIASSVHLESCLMEHEKNESK